MTIKPNRNRKPFELFNKNSIQNFDAEEVNYLVQATFVIPDKKGRLKIFNKPYGMDSLTRLQSAIFDLKTNGIENFNLIIYKSIDIQKFRHGQKLIK